MTVLDDYCWNKFGMKVRDALGFVLFSYIDEREFESNEKRIVFELIRHGITVWTLSQSTTLITSDQDLNYLRNEAAQQAQNVLNEALDGWDWTTYFDDLWYLVYADGRPDELITKQVTPEEFGTVNVKNKGPGVYTEKEFREIYGFPPKEK